MKSNPKAALRAADNALDQLREPEEAVLRARALPSVENYADVRTLANDALYLAEKAEDSAWNDIDPEEAADEPELWEAHLSAKDAAEQARKGANDALALAQGEAAYPFTNRKVNKIRHKIIAKPYRCRIKFV